MDMRQKIKFKKLYYNKNINLFDGGHGIVESSTLARDQTVSENDNLSQTKEWRKLISMKVLRFKESIYRAIICNISYLLRICCAQKV